MNDIIKLKEVAYDIRARDGTWCTYPYPGHPRGCPNFPKCILGRVDFKHIQRYEWIAVIRNFNLKMHMELMKQRHPNWSERQLRNLLYWQPKVKRFLKETARNEMKNGDILLDIPEAHGVDVFKTMKEAGIIIERRPIIIHKVMLIGRVDPVL